MAKNKLNKLIGGVLASVSLKSASAQFGGRPPPPPPPATTTTTVATTTTATPPPPPPASTSAATASATAASTTSFAAPSSDSTAQATISAATNATAAPTTPFAAPSSDSTAQFNATISAATASATTGSTTPFAAPSSDGTAQATVSAATNATAAPTTPFVASSSSGSTAQFNATISAATASATAAPTTPFAAPSSDSTAQVNATLSAATNATTAPTTPFAASSSDSTAQFNATMPPVANSSVALSTPFVALPSAVGTTQVTTPFPLLSTNATLAALPPTFVPVPTNSSGLNVSAPGNSGNRTTDRPANGGAAVASLGLLPGILLGIGIFLLLLGLSSLYLRFRKKPAPQTEIGMEANQCGMIENPVHDSDEEKDSGLSDEPSVGHHQAPPLRAGFAVPMAVGEWGPDYETDSAVPWDQKTYYVAHQAAGPFYEMPDATLQSSSLIPWPRDVYGDIELSPSSPHYDRGAEVVLSSHARNGQTFFSQEGSAAKPANQPQAAGAYEYEELANSML